MDNLKQFIILTIVISSITGIVSLQSLNDLANSLQLKTSLLKSNSIMSNSASSSSSTSTSSSSSSIPLQPCTCAVYLSGQFTKGSGEQPKGNPALLHEQDKAYACTSSGTKQCQNKCLETIVKHLPNSASILCATIDRDCHKERAYLFVQNCNTTWQNTNLSAGREYCCKDGTPYQCPLL